MCYFQVIYIDNGFLIGNFIGQYMLRFLVIEMYIIGFNELLNGCIEVFIGMVCDVNFKFDGVCRMIKNDYLLYYNWFL